MPYAGAVGSFVPPDKRPGPYDDVPSHIRMIDRASAPPNRLISAAQHMAQLQAMARRFLCRVRHQRTLVKMEMWMQQRARAGLTVQCVARQWLSRRRRERRQRWWLRPRAERRRARWLWRSQRRRRWR